MVTYSFIVVKIKHEANDTVTLCFKQPAIRKIKYLSGQYITLIFRINGRRYCRPYSFSSAPNVDELLEITVKRVLNGIVSNHIHDKVKIGDTIAIMPPMGDFIFSYEPTIKQVFLWGAGSGITPLISLIKSILYGEQNVQVYLVYGNKNFETTIFLDKIKLFEEEFGHRFTCYHFHTKSVISKKNPNLIEGRISHDKIKEIISKADLTNAVHYICGPVGLKDSVNLALSNYNVPKSYIFSEDFEVFKDPKDFQDIISQNVLIKFAGSEHEVEIAKGKSILEGALDADIELPYSCQTGNCNSCKGKLIRGNLKLIGLNKKRDDLSSCEYLLCCSYPLTNNIIIEV